MMGVVAVEVVVVTAAVVVLVAGLVLREHAAGDGHQPLPVPQQRAAVPV